MALIAESLPGSRPSLFIIASLRVSIAAGRTQFDKVNDTMMR
jgi:hypothetical protein